MSWKERAMNALSAGSLLSYEPADTSGPILEITIGDALRAAAAAWPDRPALIEGLSKRALRRRWTFTQALQEGENAGQALGQRFRPGEHVAIWAANLPEWFFAQFGAALAGLTLVTVNPAYAVVKT
jgi:fatty-acyl-CoA synthase